MRTYVALARLPGIVRITASQLLARFPFGMIALAVLLHVHTVTGGYGVAGAVVAAFSVGEAVAGPVAGRLISAVGTRPVVLVTTLVCAAAITTIAAVPCTAAGYVVAGAIGGITVPPIMPAVRAIYPRLVPGDALSTLFALDASSQEIIWVVGPLVATTLAVAVGTGAPLLLAAAVLVGGGLWFLTAREVRDVRIPRSRHRFGRVLVAGAVPTSTATSAMLVAAYTALEVGVLGRESTASQVAGAAIALSSLGSLLGGILFGHRLRGRWGVVAATGVVFVFTVLTGLAPDAPLLMAAMFLSGVGFAPAMSVLYAAVSGSVPESETPEAFGWLGTGSLAGGAAGTAVAGVATDAIGAGGAFWTAGALAAAGVLIPLLAPRRPDHGLPTLTRTEGVP